MHYVSRQSTHALQLTLLVSFPSPVHFHQPSFPFSHSRRRWLPGQGLHPLDQCNNPPALPGACHTPRFHVVAGYQGSSELCCRRTAGADSHCCSNEASVLIIYRIFHLESALRKERKKKALNTYLDHSKPMDLLWFSNRSLSNLHRLRMACRYLPRGPAKDVWEIHNSSTSVWRGVK